MSKLKPLEYIFSLTNSGKDKLIMFCGIPFRIDRSKYYKKYCLQLPIEKNKIVFCNFNGNSYGCNPKYITEEILRRGLDYDIVWLVRSVENELKKQVFPSKVRLVGYGTKHGLMELASAKLWVDNQRKNYFIKKGLIKKENQYFIQTWHGSLGIKKLDADVKAFVDEQKQEWVSRSKYDSSMWDYLLSNSDFENKILKSALWFDKEIKQFGHPRNDVFFKDVTEISKKVRDFYNIPQTSKILLYVPSFRDDNSFLCYNLAYKKVLNALEKKYGQDWVCISRLHPRAQKYSSVLIPNNGKVIDGTFYPDIQELLVCADVLITDYSSCIFDYMLSRKPGFIFATDIDKFNNNRGFYYKLEETPFPVASNTQMLINNIETFDYDEYKRNVEKFLQEKGCIEDGHASERVVDLIEELMNK